MVVGGFNLTLLCMELANVGYFKPVICLLRLNATVGIHQDMKYTERMGFLYLKWMEKTIRSVTKLYLKLCEC